MSAEPKRKIVYWSCDPEAERLEHTDPDSAIEYHLDEIEIEHWPKELEVYGFARSLIEFSLFVSPLEYVLESLEEEYGDPDDVEFDEKSEEIQKMRAAEKVFLENVKKNYVSWACEIVESETLTINVMDWVRKHAEHWLTEEQ